jgi:hypothetical protein
VPPRPPWRTTRCRPRSSWAAMASPPTSSTRRSPTRAG